MLGPTVRGPRSCPVRDPLAGRHPPEPAALRNTACSRPGKLLQTGPPPARGRSALRRADRCSPPSPRGSPARRGCGHRNATARTTSAARCPGRCHGPRGRPRIVSQTRSPTGSARSSFNVSRHSPNRPLARYAALKRANAGRSGSGPRNASAANPSGSDMPARTAEARSSTASGQSSRSATCRRRRIRCRTMIGPRKANTAKQAATARVDVIPTTIAPTTTAQTSCTPSNCTGPTPSTPAWRSRSVQRTIHVGVVTDRRLGARGPLRQISSNPQPNTSPKRAPTSRLPDRARHHPMPQRRDEVDASCLEQLGTGRITVGALETSTPRTENVGGLDDVAFNPAGYPDDLAHPPVPGAGHVHDDVDAGRHGRHHAGTREQSSRHCEVMGRGSRLGAVADPHRRDPRRPTRLASPVPRCFAPRGIAGSRPGLAAPEPPASARCPDRPAIQTEGCAVSAARAQRCRPGPPRITRRASRSQTSTGRSCRRPSRQRPVGGAVG
jgi:hypothetical protein